MLRHVVNVVVVLDKCVSIFTLLVGGRKPAGKDFGVFLAEVDEDAGKSHFLTGVFPEALESVRLVQVLHDSKLSPVAKAVFVFPETLGRDTARVVEPMLGKSCVKFLVVVGLQGQPTTANLLRVAEFNAHAEEQVFDVLLREVVLLFFGGLFHFAEFALKDCYLNSNLL